MQASSSIYLRLFFAAVLFQLVTQTHALPAPLPPWLADMIPHRGANITSEIKCYSLPYGGIGFLSHCLTYWAFVWLGQGRRPYFPFIRLSAGTFDLWLCGLQIITTIIVSAFTMSRCRSRWQFVVIAVWKMVMSLVVGMWSLTACLKAIVARGYGKHASWEAQWTHSIWQLAPFVLCVYSAGTVIGLVGLVSIVAQNIHDAAIRNITILFGALAASGGIFCFLFFFFPQLPPTVRSKDFGRRPSAELPTVLSVRTLPLSLPAAVLVLSASGLHSRSVVAGRPFYYNWLWLGYSQ
jgi:hypothetical protein